MRVARRTRCASPCAAAAATSGITALANPAPTMKTMKKLVDPSTTAASSTTPYQPTMIVSVTCSAICARWLPISGRPSARVARAWPAGVSGGRRVSATDMAAA
jgi:hypothetical protein